MNRYCRTHGIVPADHRCGRHAKRNQKLRQAIARSATVCALCGKPPTPDDPLAADHILAQAHGGQDTIGNLRAVHRSCNSRAGAALVNG